MKALVYTGSETLDFQEVEQPTAGQDDALIKIAYSGICGSDMHAFLGHDPRRPAPLILGHEAAGHIVGGPQNGKRVTINPLVTCGTCRDCLSGRTNLCANRQIISMPPRPGAFAEFVTMPRENLVGVPDDVPLQSAALAEPLACGWHGVRMGQSALRDALDQTRCLVIGGGAIGVGAALSLRANGATDIAVLEPNPLRRAVLDAIDGFTAHAPDDLGTQDDGSFDLVIDGVGFAKTRQAASRLVRAGGVIVHIGLGEDAGGLDIRRMTLQEIQFIGTYTYTAQDFRDTAQAIFDGRFGSLDWVETRALADGAAAFDDIRQGRVSAPKIILTP